MCHRYPFQEDQWHPLTWWPLMWPTTHSVPPGMALRTLLKSTALSTFQSLEDKQNRYHIHLHRNSTAQNKERYFVSCRLTLRSLSITFKWSIIEAWKKPLLRPVYKTEQGIPKLFYVLLIGVVLASSNGQAMWGCLSTFTARWNESFSKDWIFIFFNS